MFSASDGACFEEQRLLWCAVMHWCGTYWTFWMPQTPSLSRHYYIPIWSGGLPHLVIHFNAPVMDKCITMGTISAGSGHGVNLLGRRDKRDLVPQ
jgi:hypothetical protein